MALKVYTAREKCPCKYADIVHYTSRVQNAPLALRCTAFCTVIASHGKKFALLAHLVRPYSAPRGHRLQQKCSAVRKNVLIRNFWHSIALLVLNIAGIAHLCAEKLRIAKRFRHRNVPIQPLTARVTAHARTDFAAVALPHKKYDDLVFNWYLSGLPAVIKY